VTEKAAPVMKSIKPIKQEHFELIWGWMEKEMLGQYNSENNG